MSDLSEAFLPALGAEFVAKRGDDWQSQLGYLRVDDHLELVWGRLSPLSGVCTPKKAHVFTIIQEGASLYYNGRCVSPVETPLAVMVSKMGESCDLSIAQSAQMISLLVDPDYFAFLYETLLDQPIEVFLEKSIVPLKCEVDKGRFLDLIRSFVAKGGSVSRAGRGPHILESFILALTPEVALRGVSCGGSIALKAHSLMMATPDREIGIREVCESLGASSSPLQHEFQEVYGVGLVEYHRISRYHRARIHIRNNGVESGELTGLMGEFGFEHTGRFMLEYEKLFGVSPFLDQRPEEVFPLLVPHV